MLTMEQRLKNLETPIGPVDMVLDTDAYNEIDDQFAISYALHATEKLNVLALYAAPFFNNRSSRDFDAAAAFQAGMPGVSRLRSLSAR